MRNAKKSIKYKNKKNKTKLTKNSYAIILDKKVH